MAGPRSWLRGVGRLDARGVAVIPVVLIIVASTCAGLAVPVVVDIADVDPDSPFYGLERAGEAMRGVGAFDQARERLGEYRRLDARGLGDEYQPTFNEFYAKSVETLGHDRQDVRRAIAEWLDEQLPWLVDLIADRVSALGRRAGGVAWREVYGADIARGLAEGLDRAIGELEKPVPAEEIGLDPRAVARERLALVRDKIESLMDEVDRLLETEPGKAPELLPDLDRCWDMYRKLVVLLSEVEEHPPPDELRAKYEATANRVKAIIYALRDEIGAIREKYGNVLERVREVIGVGLEDVGEGLSLAEGLVARAENLAGEGDLRGALEVVLKAEGVVREQEALLRWICEAREFIVAANEIKAAIENAGLTAEQIAQIGDLLDRALDALRARDFEAMRDAILRARDVIAGGPVPPEFETLRRYLLARAAALGDEIDALLGYADAIENLTGVDLEDLAARLAAIENKIVAAETAEQLGTHANALAMMKSDVDKCEVAATFAAMYDEVVAMRADVPADADPSLLARVDDLIAKAYTLARAGEIWGAIEYLRGAREILGHLLRPPYPELEFDLATNKEQYDMGESVVITARLTNASSENITIVYPGWWYGWFTIGIFAADGREVYTMPPVVEIMVVLPPPLVENVLMPGDSLTAEYVWDQREWVVGTENEMRQVPEGTYPLVGAARVLADNQPWSSSEKVTIVLGAPAPRVELSYGGWYGAAYGGRLTIPIPGYGEASLDLDVLVPDVFDPENVVSTATSVLTEDNAVTDNSSSTAVGDAWGVLRSLEPTDGSAALWFLSNPVLPRAAVSVGDEWGGEWRIVVENTNVRAVTRAGLGAVEYVYGIMGMREAVRCAIVSFEISVSGWKFMGAETMILRGQIGLDVEGRLMGAVACKSMVVSSPEFGIDGAITYRAELARLVGIK